MKKTSTPTLNTALHLGALACTAAVLSACVVQERVYRPPPPPPPRVYAPPPADATLAVEVRATEAPPPLPDYEQPPCPEDGYLWTPGYWHWSGVDYYWVPGTWVQPPRVGFLWTPGYWAFVGGIYGWHAGYWGPHVGFYGGVNYGFGYVGVGFAGGHWAGNSFAYNTSVNNVNTTIIHNTYNTTVVNNVTVNKVSYNGGSGGVAAAPTAQERVAATEQHVAPTPMQRQHVQQAVANPALAARANGGRPSIAATPRPAAFAAAGVVGARGAAPAHLPPSNSGQPSGATGVASPVAHPAVAQAQSPRPQARTQPQQPRPSSRAPGQPRPGQSPKHPPAEAKKHEPEH